MSKLFHSLFRKTLQMVHLPWHTSPMVAIAQGCPCLAMCHPEATVAQECPCPGVCHPRLQRLRISLLFLGAPFSKSTTLAISPKLSLCLHLDVGLFSSISELSITDYGGTYQFMALSHTGHPCSPYYQTLQWMNAWKLFPTLIQLPKFQRISKVVYTEIHSPLKLAFKALYCKWS